MDFIYYNNPYEPKAYHTLEFERIHIVNGALKLIITILAIFFAYTKELNFKQGLVVLILALIAECIIYRKMFHWKKKASASLSVNILVAYIIAVCIWFASLFALDAFNLENARNDILLFFAVIGLSMAIKIFSIHQDFEAISPLNFRDLKGRIISSCIYAFILITMGIILSLTAGIPMIRTVSYITGAVFAAAYVIIFNTHKPRIKEKGSTAKVSFFNRLSAKKRLEYETITWQFHKSSDLSDLEYEVLNRDPELKAEYDEIQKMVEDLMGDLLSPHSYNSRYYDEKMAALLEKRHFFEKLQAAKEDYIRQMNEEKERKAREEREEEERRRQEEREKERQKQSRSAYSGYTGFIFFHNIKNEKQLNKEYRRLAKRFHPDSPNGDNEKFVAMQKEYERLKKNLNCA